MKLSCISLVWLALALGAILGLESQKWGLIAAVGGAFASAAVSLCSLCNGKTEWVKP